MSFGDLFRSIPSKSIYVLPNGFPDLEGKTYQGEEIIVKYIKQAADEEILPPEASVDERRNLRDFKRESDIDLTHKEVVAGNITPEEYDQLIEGVINLEIEELPQSLHRYPPDEERKVMENEKILDRLLVIGGRPSDSDSIFRILYVNKYVDVLNLKISEYITKKNQGSGIIKPFNPIIQIQSAVRGKLTRDRLSHNRPSGQGDDITVEQWLKDKPLAKDLLDGKNLKGPIGLSPNSPKNKRKIKTKRKRKSKRKKRKSKKNKKGRKTKRR